MVQLAAPGADVELGEGTEQPAIAENRGHVMSHRIKAAHARPDFSVQIEWRDGSRDAIDFKPIIARGGVMSRLADPEFFVNAL